MSKTDGASKKSWLEAIRSLEAQIAIHEARLAEFPNAQAASKWRREIANFKRQIAKHRRKL